MFYIRMEETPFKNKKGEIEMTREKMIENLKEIGSITLDSKELENVMPLVFDYIKDMIEEKEELKLFQNGEYLVDIYFADVITYTAGKDRQQLNNEPRWADDKWGDIDDDVLESLIDISK